MGTKIDDGIPIPPERRIYCHKCKQLVGPEEVVWIDPYTFETTWDGGEAFHVACAPPQREEQGDVQVF